MKAKVLNPYYGKPVYSVPVVVQINHGADPRATDSTANTKMRVNVIAHSAIDAANMVRDELAVKVEHPTEIEAYGPRGGMIHRFIGWFSLVGARMFEDSKPEQLKLEFK